MALSKVPFNSIVSYDNQFLEIGKTKRYRYNALVSQTTSPILLNSNGNPISSSQTNLVYRVRLVTMGTATNTGNVYLARNVDALGWEIRKVSGDDIYSNVPGLIVEGGVVKLKTNHTSEYSISVDVEEYDGGNSGTSWSVFGLETGITVDYNGRVTLPYQPAFTVWSPTASGLTDGIIVYNSVITNIGSHYNTSTGLFTAPITGKYIFHCTTFGNTGSGSTAYFFTQFYKNNSSTGPITHSSYSDSRSYETISDSQILYLQANDTVGVRFNGYNGAAEYTGSYSHFSGYLLG